MEKIVSCYSPYNVNNLYADNIKRLLNNQNIETVSIRKCLMNIRVFYQCKIFNFNWFEKIDSDSNLKNRVIYFLKIALLKWLKFNKKKIVYTLHNKKPHDLLNDKYSIKMMAAMCKYADVIVGLCPETKEVISSLDEKYVEKFKLILHPNYISNYNLTSNDSKREKYNIDKNDLVFLFIGAVSPYKNIESLIDIVNGISNSKIKLIIAGNPSNIEYKNMLIDRMENNKNIIFDFRYIPNDEIVAFYNTADIVVLPYHKVSSLNSGAVYLSFSLKKTVICPDIGTINALENKHFVYNYDYETEEEHFNKLNLVIGQVCQEFQENPDSIKDKGLSAFKYMESSHNDSKISIQYRMLYCELTNLLVQ